MDATVQRPHAAHAPVIYKTFVPPPPYDGFIENIWYWEGYDPGHAKDTIMASGRTGIMVNLSEDALTWYDGERYGRRNCIPGIAVCGTHSTHFAIDAFQASNMGVQFKPGGAFAFFGGSAREFANAHVSLADIWGADAHRLHQRLVAAPTPDAKMAILFRAMVGRYQESERHPAVALAPSRFARAPASHQRARGGARGRGQRQAAHPSVRRTGRHDTEDLSARIPVPARSWACPYGAERRLDGRGRTPRILRPAAFHPRVPEILRFYAYGVFQVARTLSPAPAADRLRRIFYNRSRACCVRKSHDRTAARNFHLPDC